MSTPVIAAPIRADLQIFIGAECKSNFQVAYVDPAAGGIVRVVNMAGRSFRMEIRKADSSRTLLINTANGGSGSTGLLAGDTTRIAINLPSTLTATFPAGRYTYSIYDKTDENDGATALVATGACYIDYAG
jgi:hypothetical protein